MARATASSSCLTAEDLWRRYCCGNLPEEIQLSPEADEDVSTGWFTGEVRPGGEDNEFKLF